MYCVERSRMWSFFGAAKEKFLDQARKYHAEHPGEAIKWAWLPPIMNETYRGVPRYDPRFGEVFYRGEWEKGWDLEAALRSIDAPVTYEKSEARVGADGILMGATSDLEAGRARALLKDARFYEDSKNHAWHCLDPDDFVEKLLELKARAGM